MEPISEADAAPAASTLHLPRILCLHGGGTNARIFATQCRSIIQELRNDFRLVFADAAWPSQAGPDVTAVYGEWGPFRRWIRWLPQHPPATADAVVRALDESLRAAMRRDDARGATGEWAALLGFSQGAQVSASLLYRQQLRDGQGQQRDGQGQQQDGQGQQQDGQNQQPGAGPGPGPEGDDPSVGDPSRSDPDPRFRFGVLMAGSAPLVALEPALCPSPPLSDASQPPEFTHAGPHAHVIRTPTLHVHGLLDPGLERHRRLYDSFCHPETRILVEWEGDHRLPLKQVDVRPVAWNIRRLARETGVYGGA